MYEFNSEEPTRPDIKHPSKPVVQGPESDTDAVNGNVGSVTGYMKGHARPIEGEFIEPTPVKTDDDGYVWEGFVPTPFPVAEALNCRCTEEMTRSICELIFEGNFPDVAATASGIVLGTFQNWMIKGKQGIEPFAAFRASVTRAQALAEAEMVRKSARGDDKGTSYGPSKAALELLSRSRPKRWSQQMRIELGDQLNQLLDAVQLEVSPEVYNRILARIADVDEQNELLLSA